MSALDLKQGFEEVFTVMDYYDSPRKGIANFRGQPHFYDCIFSETEDEYSELYRLTPISKHILDLANEDWEIWQRWESAYYAGSTSLESHPCLPQDRKRHDEIRSVLDPVLKTGSENFIVQVGTFEVIGTPILSKSKLRPLQVQWSDPIDNTARH